MNPKGQMGRSADKDYFRPYTCKRACQGHVNSTCERHVRVISTARVKGMSRSCQQPIYKAPTSKGDRSREATTKNGCMK